jgi:cold shock CspA family protein
MRLFISKYIPDKLYGFATDSNDYQIFFHLGSFHPGENWSIPSKCHSCSHKSCNVLLGPPPPILGEEVEVLVNQQEQLPNKALKAEKVSRIQVPKPIQGTVEIFDHHRGFGFVKGDDNQSYHLHKSEFLDNRIPRIGQVMLFYGGIRQGKPRACHVKICPTE